MPIPFAPSAEQQTIIKAVLAGHDLVVQAGAGTGKSTTLAFAAEATKEHRPSATAWFITFNKRNADEVGATFAEYGLTNAKASTAHALANRACRASPALAHMVTHLNRDPLPLSKEMQLLNIPRASRCMAAMVKWNSAKNEYDYARPPSYDLPFRTQRRFLALTRETVKRFCQSADESITAEHVPHLGELDGDLRPLVRGTLVKSARLLWDELSAPAGRLRTSHDHYLKAWALTHPVIGSPGDVLLYDEAQDANPVLADVVMAQRDRVQLVLVGDPFQELYSWNGSVDAMQGFQHQEGVITLPLEQSRRFGQTIADEANEVLDLIDPDHEVEMRLVGIGPSFGQVCDDFTDADVLGVDAVVCATNSQVIEQISEQARAGRRVHCTLDFKELVSLASDVAQVEAGQAEEANEPILRRFTDLDAWREWLKSTPDSAEEFVHTQVQLVRKHGPAHLEMLSRTVVSDPKKADVTVSTIHKAKGGTWNKVLVEMGEVSVEDLPRLRMLYVAITRAETLVLRRAALVEAPDKSASRRSIRSAA